MRINMAQINAQVSQLRQQAAVLRETQIALLSYKRNLNAHWRAASLIPLNQILDDNIRNLGKIAANLESISSDILREAELIRMREEQS